MYLQTPQGGNNSIMNKNLFRTAVILCGGRGTRLGDLSKKIPKTLVEVQGKPIIWYIINILKKNNFNHFILPLGYKGEKIKNYLYKENFLNIKVDFVYTGVNTKIGKRIYLIKNKILSNNFLILNGDAIFDFNINKMFIEHLKKKIDNTFVSNEYIYPFGTVGVKNGKVLDFKRNLAYDSVKTRASKNYTAFNYSGISIMRTELLKKNSNIFKNSDNFELSLYPNLIKNNKTSLIKARGVWHSIDNLKDLHMVNNKKISKKKYMEIKKLKLLLKK